MALVFLTIQPMSAECERLFSAAGRMVTPLRSRLEAQVIGTCQVLRSWLRAGIIRWQLIGGHDELIRGHDP
ncbi:hAT family dimerization domain protein [Fusarium oxysporum f. sp. phaseoli]